MTCLRREQRDTWDTLTKAILWSVWLERNKHIFDSCFCYTLSVIFEVTNMFSFWVSTTPYLNQQKLEELANMVKRSLEFVHPRRVSRVAPDGCVLAPSSLSSIFYLLFLCSPLEISRSLSWAFFFLCWASGSFFHA